MKVSGLIVPATSAQVVASSERLRFEDAGPIYLLPLPSHLCCINCFPLLSHLFRISYSPGLLYQQHKMTTSSTLHDQTTRWSSYSDRTTQWLTGLPDLQGGAPGAIGNGVYLPFDAPVPEFEMNEMVHYTGDGIEVHDFTDYLIIDIGYNSERDCLVYRIHRPSAGLPRPAAPFIVADEQHLVAGRYRQGDDLRVVLESGLGLRAHVMKVQHLGLSALYRVKLTSGQWVTLVDIIQKEAIAVGDTVSVKLQCVNASLKARVVELPEPGSSPGSYKLNFPYWRTIFHENTAYRKLWNWGRGVTDLSGAEA